MIRKFYISGSHYKRLGGLSYCHSLQNGGFWTFYITGSRCIVYISVWEVCSWWFWMCSHSSELSLKKQGRCGVYHCCLKAKTFHLPISISHLLNFFLIVLSTFCVVLFNNAMSSCTFNYGLWFVHRWIDQEKKKQNKKKRNEGWEWINIKMWSIIQLFVLLCALVECQCVLAYQTHTHSQDPWELITHSIHCIPKWQMLFNLNALQEGHLVGMFHWEPMTYIHASSYTTCSRLWVINYNEGKVYGRVIFKRFSIFTFHFSTKVIR